MNSTLMQAITRSDSMLVRALLVLGGSGLIALAAQISVPMIPVPMTLQTLAVLLVGLSMGARMGAVTLLAYLAEGAMGLPVFANGMNGAAFAGPTAGFLFGFVGMAFIAGLAAGRNFVVMAAAALLASALLYVPGVAWAMLADTVLGFDASKWGADSFANIWAYYMQPFLIGDAVKAVIAALIVAGGWAALKSRKV